MIHKGHFHVILHISEADRCLIADRNNILHGGTQKLDDIKAILKIDKLEVASINMPTNYDYCGTEAAIIAPQWQQTPNK